MPLMIETAPDRQTLAEIALERIEVIGAQCLAERDRFILSLAGGGTPADLYRLWSQGSALDWRRLELLLGDERCVPSDHPDSNEKMIRETLLDPLAEQPVFHPVMQPHQDPEQAAIEYGRLVKALLNPEDRLDLALLGLGTDGHTASLFPHAEALEEEKHRCVTTTGPGGAGRRITLTLPLYRRARNLIFLVSGAEKAATVREVLYGELDPRRLPAQFLLRDQMLNVILLLDEDAAAGLDSSHSEETS